MKQYNIPLILFRVDGWIDGWMNCRMDRLETMIEGIVKGLEKQEESRVALGNKIGRDIEERFDSFQRSFFVKMKEDQDKERHRIYARIKECMEEREQRMVHNIKGTTASYIAFAMNKFLGKEMEEVLDTMKEMERNGTDARLRQQHQDTTCAEGNIQRMSTPIRRNRLKNLVEPLNNSFALHFNPIRPPSTDHPLANSSMNPDQNQQSLRLTTEHQPQRKTLNPPLSPVRSTANEIPRAESPLPKSSSLIPQTHQRRE